MRRGEIWWADLDEPVGSAPGYRRPVIVVQADGFNRSQLRTVIAVALTTNPRWLGARGNVAIPAGICGLAQNSVANVTQITTVDRNLLTERIGELPADLVRELDHGLRLVFGL